MEFNHCLACVYTPFKKLQAVFLSVETVPVVCYLLALPVFSLPPVGFYANCALRFSNMNENIFDSELIKKEGIRVFF